MSVQRPAHELVIDLIEAARDAIEPGYYLGYEIIHTNVPDADRVAGDAAMKANWRARLNRNAQAGKAGASDDAAAIPPDATDAAGVHVLFEIIHLETGLQAVRTVPMATLVTAAQQWQTATATQKQKIEAQVQTYLQSFYDLCAARVAESNR